MRLEGQEIWGKEHQDFKQKHAKFAKRSYRILTTVSSWPVGSRGIRDAPPAFASNYGAAQQVF